MKRHSVAVLMVLMTVAGVLAPQAAMARGEQLVASDRTDGSEFELQVERPQREAASFSKPVSAAGRPGPVSGPDGFVNPCPQGTTGIWWDMPVYDDDGLFVIGYVMTWWCIPDDLQPAG